jgi:hypothetical protein
VRVYRRCSGNFYGLRCAGIVTVVLVGPAGNRFGRCHDCAERDLAEYNRTESGWSIDEATEEERTMEVGE